MPTKWNRMDKRPKKFRVGFAVLAMLLCASWPAAPVPAAGAEQAETPAALFSDIDGHWAKDSIEWAAKRGIAAGYEDGTFRPDQPVSEREFIAFVLRARPEPSLPSQAPGEPWHARYYEAAENLGWPVEDRESARPYTRGDAARIIAASRGRTLPEREAILYLLENGLSSGKTAPTPAGYQADDPLTRAEAMTFLYNVERAEAAGEKPSEKQSSEAFALRGVRIGDPESKVLAVLGEPDRLDASPDGYTWLVYNRDYRQYAQIGVSDGQVTALFSNADVWQAPGGVVPGVSPETAAAGAGIGADRIRGRKSFAYARDGLSVTLFLDRQDGGRVEGLLVEKRTAGAVSVRSDRDALAAAYERQIFDMTNAFRAKNGLPALEWNDPAAEAARAHSADMAERGYFDHVTPDGRSPGDRLKAAGLDGYAAYAENIAAGQDSAFTAFNGWINSPGHRANILGEGLETLGVGVVYDADSDYGWYYTQNFYTPPRW